VVNVLVTFTFVIPLAVIAVGVPIGLVMLQFKLTLQLLEPAEMVQVDVAGVSVPVIWTKEAVTEQLLVMAPVV